MARVYDEVELDDMSYDEAKDVFHSPCPCGDRFEISMAQLREGEDIARCPSCSLLIRVIFDPMDLEDDDEPMLAQGPAAVATAA